MAWWEEHRRSARAYATVWNEPEGPARIVSLALTVAAVHFVAVLTVARTGVPYAVAVPLAAVFGPAGAWGVAIGVGLGELMTGGIGIVPLVAFLDVFACAVIGRSVWLSLAYPYRRRPALAAAAILPVAAAAVLVGAGIAATLLSTVNIASFAIVAWSLVVERLLLLPLFAPPIVFVGTLRGDVPVTGLTLPRRWWLGAVVRIAAVAGAWLLAASVLSLARADIRSMPDVGVAAAERLPPVLDHLFLLVTGPYGWLLELVLATVAITLVWTILEDADGPASRPVRVRGPVPEEG